MSSTSNSEEWRHCAQWLIRCGVLTPEHRSTHLDAGVFDLAQHLRDGVILCHLALKLAPGSVENISQRPQMSQFLCLQNIRLFLRALVETFKLPRDALFEPQELFNLTNFGRVISCLSRLSKTPIAIDTTHAFPPDSFSGYEDEDIYMPLENLADEKDIDDEEMEDVYECVTEMEGEEEEIYDSICKHKKGQLVADCADLPVPKTKRDHCLKELVETEQNYVDALDMIVKNFVQPLKGVITKEDREKIFINVEDLKHFHSNFLLELRKLYPNDVSEVFIKFKASFLAYGKYCSLLQESQEHIEILKKRSESIRVKFEECEKMAKDGRFRLRDILSVPMQRVLKYPLLLRELSKTSGDQDDRTKEKLDECLEAMQDVALFVNEVKRDNETMQNIRQIQKSIIDINMPANTSLTDYGKLQRDGQVSIKAHEDRMSRQRHIFLFDKVLLICKPKGDDFRYKSALDLSKYRVEDRERGVGVGAAVVDKWSHQFVLSETSNNHAYTLYAKTRETKRKWIEAIKLALENTSPPESRTATHEFVLQTFHEPTYCSICRKLLHGIFFQGYRCDRTDMNAHKGCISKASERSPRPGSSDIYRSSSNVYFACHPYNGSPFPGPDFPIITFQADQELFVLDQSDSNWWRGCCVESPSIVGVFPASCVSSSRPPGGSRQEPGKPPSRRSKRATVDDDVPRKSNGYIHVGPFTPGEKSKPKPKLSCGAAVDLTSFPWFAVMSREEAGAALDHAADGTFMIRLNKDNYALSIAYGGSVKHIRVKKEEGRGYFIADVKFFDAIPQLVEFYSSVSLVASFPGLDTTLIHAHNGNNNDPRRHSSVANDAGGNNSPGGTMPRQREPPNVLPILSYANAIYDFSPSAVNQIALKEGDRVAIVSKAGGDRGWWKGQVVHQGRGGSKKIGYFPMNYVKEED